ncbi:hypothetical protein JOF56_005745 [Kibdelosporangium banguiense]|uniref:XRE family transcriptional regulator n=1 Tax=Kibdelosporangium banguiense TaxID=1365924 RepID=A0ABS4TLS4_9PSEU|nr:XRE family transcriptional regulator [Kibdelosporangium banguiense]MBP2325360.1 hypothetical protein [Kibdelosporangium banguiense]
MREANDHLRRARERMESPTARGEPLTRQELAELVNAWVYENRKRVVELTANYIGKMERGALRWPGTDYRDGLCAVLGVGTYVELGFRRPRRTASTVANVDRKEFLRTALGVGAAAVTGPVAFVDLITTSEPTPVPSVIGTVEIEEVRTAARVFSSWDHTYGGGLVREAVAAQLRHAVNLLGARCPERLRSELYSSVGYLGNTAAFMAFDAYAHEDARKMFRLALACAEEAGDWHLRAKVLSSMARQAIWCGDPDNGLTLVELAMVRADRLTPAERAMLLSARARALAKLERAQDTVGTVGMADEEFSKISRNDESPWMRYYDAAQHSGDTGHALWDLAVQGQFIGEARNRLAAAVAGHSDDYPRSRAISGTKLAALVMVTGDPCEAAMIGSRAIADAGTVRSRRAVDDMRELRRLAAKHEHVTEVAELRNRIGGLVATK